MRHDAACNSSEGDYPGAANALDDAMRQPLVGVLRALQVSRNPLELDGRIAAVEYKYVHG